MTKKLFYTILFSSCAISTLVSADRCYDNQGNSQEAAGGYCNPEETSSFFCGVGFARGCFCEFPRCVKGSRDANRDASAE